MSGRFATKIKKAVYPALHIFDYLSLRIMHRQESGLPPEAWDMTSKPGGHLSIQGSDSVSLARQYGTPLYVVNKRKLEKDYLNFYSSFHSLYPHIEISYSYKTNPLPGVIKILHQLGAGAEVISHFELWLALKLGVSPEKIIYNGPCKTEESLNIAVSHKIKLINIDGMAEIETIDRLARQHGHRQQVGGRVVTSVGWASQFGFSIKNGDALDAFQRLIKLDNVIPCGLHVHLGTGIKNVGTYLRAIREVLDLSQFLRRELGITIRYFDFGGGFGVPTVKHYSGLDNRLFAKNLPAIPPDVKAAESISDYASSIIELFREYYPAELDEHPTIIFEPGRAITSSAQSLLLKVVAIKPGVNGMTNVIVDGGKNIAIPTSWEYHEVFAVSKIKISPTNYYKIFGPLCHPNDVLFPVKKLPELEPGDILAIMDAGAYFVPNQRNFSFPRPSVVMVENGSHKIIRERESFEHIIALDKLG